MGPYRAPATQKGPAKQGLLVSVHLPAGGWAGRGRQAGGEARVAELERRLNRSSRNSSLPPSQDPPSAPPRPGGKRSGRGRGGQLGHEGRL